MDFQEQYEALLRADPAYEGRFIVGVRTTGIFCRPTCRARKPKAENCEFYSTTKEALLAGYRPCKMCHPLETAEPVPALIQELLAEVDSFPQKRIRDDEVRRRGLDPGTVRRWFQKHHGLTFQGYQRALRLGLAFGRIQQGQQVTEVAFGSGYESLSGFADSFKKVLGTAPTRNAAKGLLRVTRIPTPLGVMVAGAVDEGLCLLEFADRRTVESELADLERLLSVRALPGGSPHFDRLSDQLDGYFAGITKSFDLPLVFPGTSFQISVWQSLLAIPFGQTRSYRDQAESVGKPAAVRAVGTANGANRLAIVVPCHRVIGSDGALAGYGGGLWRKQWLLDLESGRLTGAGNLP